MTLQTFFPALLGRTRVRTTPRTASLPQPPQYRIVVVALTSQASRIDELVRTSLHGSRLAVQAPVTTARAGGYLAELSYTLRCGQGQRAALVHLVTRLGDTAGVRAIRWETAPAA
ncbi:hypothetical protein PTE30175_03292 [Pandoraea terrae]|uniref:ACT domain-containing protein n=1 Tax=Pandoraea terrae TaxID=1537710 RepID=A0A5E4WPT3_9BURK|nr:hypothetical protein [Pandoraea terrae]VVE25624.1 hypothetical protein PTE30175_03292 [Pandoraea terrae]